MQQVHRGGLRDSGALAGSRPSAARMTLVRDRRSWRSSEAPLVATPPPGVVSDRTHAGADQHADLRHRVRRRVRGSEVVQPSVTSHESTRSAPSSSGSAFVTAQLSRTPRPVLVPPCTVSPMGQPGGGIEVDAVPVRRAGITVVGFRGHVVLRAAGAGGWRDRHERRRAARIGQFSCCGTVRLYRS